MQKDLAHALDILNISKSIRQSLVDADMANDFDREFIVAVDTVSEFIIDILHYTFEKEGLSCKQ